MKIEVCVNAKFPSSLDLVQASSFKSSVGDKLLNAALRT
jgi:hypothetical protein